MDLTKRQNEILNLLIEQNTVHSSDLSEKYSVSTETIRKDLNVLDALGYAKKHHGYATISPQYLKEYLNIDSKKGLNNQEKIAIAQRALSFVPDNSVIYCDSGTTVCELVRLLVARSSVTIVTPSLAIVEIMKSLPDKNHHLFLFRLKGRPFLFLCRRISCPNKRRPCLCHPFGKPFHLRVVHNPHLQRQICGMPGVAFPLQHRMRHIIRYHIVIDLCMLQSGMSHRLVIGSAA